MKGKRRRGRQKRWENKIKKWAGIAELGQLKTCLGGKGVLLSHLWGPKDLARLWDRLDYRLDSRNKGGKKKEKENVFTDDS